MRKNKPIYGILFILICFITPIYGKSSEFKEVKKEKYQQDIVHTYYHEKSGLEVIWIENQDVNKTFMIGVKTPTTDHTGVNHILEHTLFTGSKNYPSPSLFFDASEAYPSTYMNALTSGDMTIFPFSTPYLPCYEKLLNIYLDAVFQPNLLKEPYGFYEEGFHFVPQEGRSGGVVYNEMKGAYGNMERMIYRSLRNMIYEDTHYAFDSGGMPDAIPTLTYEAFVETYYRYYYPGNMKVIVYGAVPIKETLDTILGYVENIEDKKPDVDLSVKTLSKTPRLEVAGLPNTDRACIAKSFVIQEPVSSTDIQKLDLWMMAYLMNPQTYFQSRLLQQGIHVKWLKDDDLPYPIYTVVMTDVPCTEVENYEKLLDIIIEMAPKHLAKNVFLEQDILKQAKWLWEKQENNNNRGIDIGQSILDSWAHNKELMQYYLKKEQIEKMTTLDSKVSELLFSKAQRYTLILLPKAQEFLQPETLSPIDEIKWQKLYEEIKVWQNRKFDLDPIELEKLVTNIENPPTILKKDDYWEMETRMDTSLIRSQLYFNTSHLKSQELPYLFLYSYLLEESAKDISPFSGMMDTQVTAYPLKEGYWPCFKFSIITSPKETNHEILLNEARSYLLECSSSWYRQKLIEYTTNIKSSVQNNSLAILSQLCPSGEDERSSYLYQQGYPQYEFCCNLLELKSEDWIKQIKAIDEKLYHKNGVILATTIPKKGKNLVAQSWDLFLKELPSIPNLKADYELKVPEGNSLVKSNTPIDYSFKVLNKSQGIDGVDYLYAAYLTKQYLNPQIRVKLGAYGTGCQVYDLQTLGIYTYRDPDYQLSSKIVDLSVEFLKNPIKEIDLNCSKAEALSRVHRQFRLLGTPLEKAEMVEHLILWGKSPNEVIHLQKEILEATPEKLVNRQEEYQSLLDRGKKAVMTKKDCSKEQNFTIYRY